jgi:hypothetical protein
MRKGSGCKNGIRSRHDKETAHLRTWRKTASSFGGLNRREQPQMEGVRKYNDILWKTFRLEIVKRAAVTSMGLRRILNWTLWRGRPVPKRKEELQVEREPVI